MPRRRKTPEEALRELQDALRREGPPPPAQMAMSRTIPDDLARDGMSTLFLGRTEERAFEQAIAAVHVDPRFEYLDKKAKDHVWRFACQAALDEGPDFVPAFVHEHGREPERLTCFFPIEALKVDRERKLENSVLMPTDDERVPPEGLGFELSAPVSSVLSVPAEGTHYGRMAERAAALADHDLRVLRIALRAHRSVHDQQLRFRRAMGYSFGGRLSGWKLPPDTAFDLGLSDEVYTVFRESTIARIPVEPRTDVEAKAALALRWTERGFLSTDPVESLLFFFFALEALLGRQSDRLKGRWLAFRRAMLSHVTTGGFSDPDRLYSLYDDVRSAAVHGSEPPEVDAQVVRRFGWDVRRALVEYLELAGSKGLVKRARLLKELETHPDRAELVGTLREFWGEGWDEIPEQPE